MRPETAVAGLVMFIVGALCGYFLCMKESFHDIKDLLGDIAVVDSNTTPDVRVQVVAKQYSWHFHYPGPDGVFGSTTVSAMSSENPLGLDSSDPASSDDLHSPELVLPCDSAIELLVTSADVIHSLSILNGAYERDTIPGRHISTFLNTPAAPTSGRLKCAQYCGDGHDNHHAPYKFVSDTDFSLWLNTQSTSNQSP